MSEEIILQLRVAFDNLPQKGLFFWLSLLLPKEVVYEDFVRKTFDNLSRDIPPERNDLLTHYKKIAENLVQLRNLVLSDPAVRAQVEKLRDALMKKTAHEVVMEQIKKDIKST